MNKQAVMPRVLSVLPTLLVLVFVIAYLITAYQTLDPDSRHLPVMTAWLTIFLLVLDLFFSLSGRNAGKGIEKSSLDVPLSAELKGVVSLVCLVAGVYFFGFYPAGLLYMLLAIWWLGQQPLRVAIITSLSTIAAIYLIFEKALAFQLFAGILFS
jgi:hypothetical protein